MLEGIGGVTKDAPVQEGAVNVAHHGTHITVGVPRAALVVAPVDSPGIPRANPLSWPRCKSTRCPAPECSDPGASPSDGPGYVRVYR